MMLSSSDRHFERLPKSWKRRIKRKQREILVFFLHLSSRSAKRSRQWLILASNVLISFATRCSNRTRSNPLDAITNRGGHGGGGGGGGSSSSSCGFFFGGVFAVTLPPPWLKKSALIRRRRRHLSAFSFFFPSSSSSSRKERNGEKKESD